MFQVQPFVIAQWAAAQPTTGDTSATTAASSSTLRAPRKRTASPTRPVRGRRASTPTHPNVSFKTAFPVILFRSIYIYIPPCLGVSYKTFTNGTHGGKQRLKKEPRRGRSINPKVCRILTRIFILTSTYTLPTTYCPCVIPGPKQTPISIQQQDLMLKEKNVYLVYCKTHSSY